MEIHFFGHGKSLLKKSGHPGENMAFLKLFHKNSIINK